MRPLNDTICSKYREGGLWHVFYEFKIWSVLYIRHRSIAYNAVLYWVVL